VPRKLKLTSGTSYDYTTIGVACHMKDYRFTFFLNEQLGFQFKRMDDLKLGEEEGSRGYSFYLYNIPEERRNYYLVSNFHEEGRLIPSEKGADFFLIIDIVIPAIQKKKLIDKIQKIPQILAAYDIPPGKANNLEVIFEEIEMHLL
jgi:hypothetical protein